MCASYFVLLIYTVFVLSCLVLSCLVFQAQAQDIVPTIGFSIEKFKTSRLVLDNLLDF